MPTKRSGRLVSAASVVMAIEDVVAQQVIGFGEDVALDFELFGHSLYEKIGICHGGEIRNRNQSAQQRSLLCFRQRALFNFTIQILGYRVHAAIEVALLHIAQDHLVPGTRKNVRDAVAHSPSAQHRDGFNVIDRQEKRLLPQRCELNTWKLKNASATAEGQVGARNGGR
jgi:hypothetical protein